MQDCTTDIALHDCRAILTVPAVASNQPLLQWVRFQAETSVNREVCQP